MSWEETRLDEVCNLITDGKHGDCVNQEQSGYYFISAKDVFDWNIRYENARQITKEDFDDTHRRTQLEPNDVVMVSTGASIGRLAVVKDNAFTPRTTFQKSVAILKSDHKKLYHLYLAYFLKNSNSLMHSTSSGSAQKNVLLKDLRAFKIPLCSLQTQKRIADILSAYDDLIENNLKRIKLLEQAAQNIYKEWFVNLRFPGYENTPINEETGLPVGWKNGFVSHLCEVKSGYAFKSKHWRKEGNPVIKIKNINNNTVNIDDSDFVDDEVAKIANKYELFSGDVVIAMTGATVGKVGLVPKIDKQIYLNQRVGLFRPLSEENNNIALVFSFFLTDDSQQQVLNFAQGAAQPNISGSEIGNIKLNIADSRVLSQFNKLINPSIGLIQSLYGQNQKLKAARDILLPRLMNRTIDV